MKIKVIAISALMSLGLLSSGIAMAASVTAINQDSLELEQLGTVYLHSRHPGTMPYWGECTRCGPQLLDQNCNTQSTPQGIEYSGGGNSLYIESRDCTISAVPATVTQVNATGLASSISYSNSTGGFTGTIDLTGLTEYGVVCGGNSGIEGSGASIIPLNAPPASSGSCNTTGQSAGGNPITLTGETFGGGPITVENAWGFFTISANNNCLGVSFNNGSLGSVCPFPAAMYMECHHYGPTSTQCETTSGSDYGAPTGWSCNNPAWNGSSACPINLSGGAQWLWGFNDGAAGTTVGGYFTFATQFQNNSGNAIPSILTVQANAYGWVWVDGVQVMSCAAGQTCAMDINVPTGYVNVSFMVLSAPVNANQTTRDPAGGILSIVDSATATDLLNSNSTTWWNDSATPTAPSPSQQTVLNDNGDSGFTAINCDSNGTNC